MSLLRRCISKLEVTQSVLLETIMVIFLLIYSVVRSMILWIVPKRYKDISDDIVLITGGGRGLGRMLAMEFAKHNPKQIILWGRNEDHLRATTKAVRCRNVACTYMVCDLSNKQQVYDKAQEVKDTIGTVTVLVLNAAVVFGKDISAGEDHEIERTFQVNTISHFWTIKSFLPGMIKSNKGHIVIVSSMLAFMGLAGAADYCATKCATMGMAESLHYELLNDRLCNIHLTIIHPYMINTDMFAGLKTRMDWLIPHLDKEYVAWKSLDAILTNQHQVLMPRVMYLIVIAKALLPVKAVYIISKYVGADKAMQGFYARQRPCDTDAAK